VPRSSALLTAACLSLACTGLVRAQDRPPAEAVNPTVGDIRIAGAHELSGDVIRDAARIAVGRPLPDAPDHLDELRARVLARYRDEGYTFAQASVSFDAASGALTLTIDEGVIGAVEFEGVDETLARVFADEFALRAGDVFNRRRARQALDVLLQQTRGAVRPGAVHERGGTTFTDSRDLAGRRGTFDLVERDGQRILLVGLREPAGRFKLVPDPGDREDWFTSVDGFVPSLGFGAAVFSHDDFNHAYVAGHLSYKMASKQVGYALGFERPILQSRKLYLGGELHDLTASDDQWQISSLEASLAAIGPRRSFRDYYRRRGAQINAAFRPDAHLELLFSWRGERQESLATRSDFSVWNSGEAFRASAAVRDGRLNALIVGASLAGAGFNRESLEASYRRHQFDTLFGDRLDEQERGHESRENWRVDWSSEIASPGSLGGDFDFRRHIVSARYRVVLSAHQTFGARAIGGWSEGGLPPQREFAVGGIGSVHGYDFKDETGTTLALVNLEYALGWRNGLKGIGFFDAGRATSLSTPNAPWLKGVGFGVGLGDFRVDFGYKLDAVPSSLQVLVRFGRTF
jgi:outer membrane protein assembly factor BamA